MRNFVHLVEEKRLLKQNVQQNDDKSLNSHIWKQYFYGKRGTNVLSHCLILLCSTRNHRSQSQDLKIYMSHPLIGKETGLSEQTFRLKDIFLLFFFQPRWKSCIPGDPENLPLVVLVRKTWLVVRYALNRNLDTINPSHNLSPNEIQSRVSEGFCTHPNLTLFLGLFFALCFLIIKYLPRINGTVITKSWMKQVQMLAVSSQVT